MPLKRGRGRGTPSGSYSKKSYSKSLATPDEIRAALDRDEDFDDLNLVDSQDSSDEILATNNPKSKKKTSFLDSSNDENDHEQNQNPKKRVKTSVENIFDSEDDDDLATVTDDTNSNRYIMTKYL